MYFRLRSEHSLNVQRANLAFRDYLRENREARDRYAASKRQAIDGGANTLLAYCAAKAETIRRLMELAHSAAS